MKSSKTFLYHFKTCLGLSIILALYTLAMFNLASRKLAAREMPGFTPSMETVPPELVLIYGSVGAFLTLVFVAMALITWHSHKKFDRK